MDLESRGDQDLGETPALALRLRALEQMGDRTRIETRVDQPPLDVMAGGALLALGDRQG